MIVIDGGSPWSAGHQDLHVALRDAFDAARRKLEDIMRMRRGYAKGGREAADTRGRAMPVSPHPHIHDVEMFRIVA